MSKKKYEKAPGDCHHEEVSWGLQTHAVEDGVEYRGKCMDCGSRVAELYTPTGDVEIIEE